MSSETDAMAKLRQRIQGVARTHGLTETFTLFAPADKAEGRCEVHLFLVLDDDFQHTPEVVDDADFQRVMDEAAAAEQEQKNAAAREGLEKLRDNLKPGEGDGGFL